MGTLLTTAAVLGLAAQCQHAFPPQMILAIAKQESQVSPDTFDAAAIGAPNHDGTRDYGLMQINSGNLSWLGLTTTALMDPCINIAAAEAVLKTFSGYNSGSPTKSAAYAKRAYLAQHGVASVQPTATAEVPPPQTKTDQPAIFVRKAKLGRELVINISKENQ